jgi:hypothetical protein
MKLWIAVINSLALSACVSTMPTPPSPVQPAAAIRATSAATSATPAVGPVAPESEMVHWAKAHNYKRTTVGKRILWCTEEGTVASRIPQRTCLTEDDLARIRQTNEQSKEALLNSHGGCPNGTCTKGN